MTAASMLERALYLESLRLSVFPLAPRAKKPSRDWKEHQAFRATRQEITAWWSNGGADQNIAVACGPVSDVFVVDIDGPKGEATLAALEAENGPMPSTWRVKTGRGRHYWFHNPHGLKNTAGKIGEGIDTRGYGGLVVAPGSIHTTGVTYEWEIGFDPEFTELANLPDWIIEKLIKPEPKAASEPPPAEEATLKQRPRVDNFEAFRVKQYLDGMLDSIATQLGAAGVGQRNQSLNNSAMRLGHFAHYGVFTEQSVWSRLAAACVSNGEWTDPDGGERKCRATFLSGWKAGAAAPQAIPEGEKQYSRTEDGTTFDPGTGEIHEEASIGDEFPEPKEDLEDEPFPASSLTGRPPEREWIVPDWLPAGHVTSLYGDGGTGKSLVAMLLANCIATGRPWFGLEVKKSPVMGVFAEENRDEIWRRQFDIEAMYGPPLRGALDDLYLWPRAGKDNILEFFDAKKMISKLSPFYQKLERRIIELKPRVLVLDTLADMFGGDEIIRVQVNHFIKATLGSFCAKYYCTVLLVAHPSKDGMATNRGDGGSTAWNNSVRSRWYLTKPETALDQNSRVLTRMKANYAKAGPDQKIDMIWSAGTFHAAIAEADRLPPDMIKDLLLKVNEAFDSGNPFGASPQSARPLLTWVVDAYQIPTAQAKRWIAAWISNGVLITERVGRGSKKEGLRVGKWPS